VGEGELELEVLDMVLGEESLGSHHHHSPTFTLISFTSSVTNLIRVPDPDPHWVCNRIRIRF